MKTLHAAMGCLFGLVGTSAWADVGAWSGQGPYGGYVYDIQQNPGVPSTLYVSTRSGIFKSMDSGATWAPMMNGIVGSVSYGYPLTLDADAVDTLYAADSFGHLYRTTDGAVTWMQTGYTLAPLASGIVQINKITDGPGSTTRLYLATAASGILTSTDSGATFGPLNGSGANQLPSGIPFQTIAVDPANTSHLLAGTAADDVGPGPDVPSLYRSTDGGVTWTGVLTSNPLTGETYYSLVSEISFGHGSEVYALVDGQVFRSVDGGANWSEISADYTALQFFTTTVKADTSTANSLYVGGYWGVKHSADGGSNFTDVATAANGLTPNGTDIATPSRLVQSGSNWWLATQEAGMFRSTNGGSAWNSDNAGLDATNIRALGMVPVTAGSPRILAGYGDAFRPSPGMYAGIDAGDGDIAWANSNSGLHAYQIRAIAVDPLSATGSPASTVVYAGGRSEQIVSIAPRNGGVYKSFDGGSSWNTIDDGLPVRTPAPSTPFVGTVRSIVVDPHSCQGYPGTCTSGLNTVYATSNGCFVRSDISTPTCGNQLANPGSYQFRIFKATNASSLLVPPHWSSSDVGIPASFFGSPPNYADAETLLIVPLVIDPVNTNILYAGSSDSFDPTVVIHPTLQTGIYKSTDSGATWNAVNTGLPTYPAPSPTTLGVLTMAIDPTTTSTLWASEIDINSTGGAPGHIYKTVDGGGHWNDVSAGLTSADIRALLVDPTTTGPTAILYAAGGGTAGNPGGVFKSYDAGATWHSISIGLPADAALALSLDPSDHNKLYAGTSSGVWEMTQTLDTDHDGVPDAQEDLGPNGGDSNSDGTADKFQADVTYVPPHTSARAAMQRPDVPSSNDFAVQVAQQGSTCTQTQDVQSKSADANGADTIAPNLDFDYAVDLVQFEILDCAATTVKVTYPNFTFGAGWTFRFYGPATPGDDASIKWYDFSPHAVRLDAHTWQLTLTRGAFGSYRPAVTGAILFQGGPAYSDRIFAGGFD